VRRAFRLVRQPEGSSLCGQACVAMVAGVSLRAATKAVGLSGATHTRHIVRALRSLNVECADRLRRVSRVRPALPKRAIVSIIQYTVAPSLVTTPAMRRSQRRAHWMVTWDGTMYDPGGRWTEGYNGWAITSYLEIKAE